MPSDSLQDFINRLNADLLKARKIRDQLTISTLQSILSAIDNAGAVPVSENIASNNTGPTEVERRELTKHDVHELVKCEITEAKQAIKELNNTESSYSSELGKRIVILETYL